MLKEGWSNNQQAGHLPLTPLPMFVPWHFIGFPQVPLGMIPEHRAWSKSSGVPKLPKTIYHFLSKTLSLRIFLLSIWFAEGTEFFICSGVIGSVLRNYSCWGSGDKWDGPFHTVAPA